MTALSNLKELSDVEIAVLVPNMLVEYRNRLKTELLGVLRELLDDDDVTVTFDAEEWDDGFFFSHFGAEVEMAGGATVRHSFEQGEDTDRLREVLTYIGWTVSVGRASKLTINMRTGELEECG